MSALRKDGVLRESVTVRTPSPGFRALGHHHFKLHCCPALLLFPLLLLVGGAGCVPCHVWHVGRWAGLSPLGVLKPSHLQLKGTCSNRVLALFRD